MKGSHNVVSKVVRLQQGAGHHPLPGTALSRKQKERRERFGFIHLDHNRQGSPGMAEGGEGLLAPSTSGATTFFTESLAQNRHFPFFL